MLQGHLHMIVYTNFVFFLFDLMYGHSYTHSDLLYNVVYLQGIKLLQPALATILSTIILQVKKTFDFFPKLNGLYIFMAIFFTCMLLSFVCFRFWCFHCSLQIARKLKIEKLDEVQHAYCRAKKGKQNYSNLMQSYYLQHL